MSAVPSSSVAPPVAPPDAPPDLPPACPDDLAGWLRLSTTPGLGLAAACRLLRAFGSVDAVWHAPAAAHRAVLGIAGAEPVVRPPPGFDALVDLTAGWLATAPPGVVRALVPIGDPRYPEPLLHIADPPLVLHVEGQPSWLGTPGVAIVGSRHATPQGLATARALSAGLADVGLVVVSGLARGIDAAAHEGALEACGGTVAVVGTGLDDVYPRAHRALAERVRATGLLVSEHPLGSPPRREHFPRRNRVIAGLTRGTVVVEAALASGSLITARLAADGGRDVLAVPGSIHSPQSQGCHRLLKQGAALVETVEDVLDALGWARPATPAPTPHAATVDADPLLRALGHGPIGLDLLLASTGWAAPALQARLLELELAGVVARLPGQRFQRVAARV